ncbi:hypothetical protein TRVA0_031S01794 [Trichomonascus vanleenenianus]|uniref:Hsp20/alpha crystallin family protein n=1 Tax=Trichomonascus vanleenenianus TaxID=2268995 RepID=UPI003EC9B361
MTTYVYGYNPVFDLFNLIEESTSPSRSRRRCRGGNCRDNCRDNCSKRDENRLRVSPLVSNNPSGSVVAPPVDVYDSEKEYVVVASLSGASESSINVDFDIKERKLTLSGSTSKSLRVDEDEAYRSANLKIGERSVGDFERIITFPKNVDVDEENLKAKLMNGVLKITVPKIPPVEPEIKRVSVTVEPDSPEPIDVEEVEASSKEESPENVPENPTVETPTEKSSEEDAWVGVESSKE